MEGLARRPDRSAPASAPQQLPRTSPRPFRRIAFRPPSSRFSQSCLRARPAGSSRQDVFARAAHRVKAIHADNLNATRPHLLAQKPVTLRRMRALCTICFTSTPGMQIRTAQAPLIVWAPEREAARRPVAPIRGTPDRGQSVSPIERRDGGTNAAERLVSRRLAGALTRLASRHATLAIVYYHSQVLYSQPRGGTGAHLESATPRVAWPATVSDQGWHQPHDNRPAAAGPCNGCIFHHQSRQTCRLREVEVSCRKEPEVPPPSEGEEDGRGLYL